MIYQNNSTKDNKTFRDLSLDPFATENALVSGDASISQSVKTLSSIQKRTFFNEPWLGVRLKHLLHRPMSLASTDDLVLLSVQDINSQEPRVDFDLSLTTAVADKANRVYRIKLQQKEGVKVDLQFIK